MNILRLSIASMLMGIAVTASAAEKVNFLVPAPMSLPAFAPLVIAKAKGYYDAAGYDVQFPTGRGGVDVAKQVGVGNAELGIAVGDAPIIVRGNAIPIKLVAMLGGGGLGVIVARKDRNINKMEDLRGKTLTTITFQDAIYYSTLGALAKFGISKDQTEIQAVGPAGLMQLVIAGSADACICTPDTGAMVADALKDTIAMPLKSYVPTTAQGIVASEAMIAKRPDLVKGMVQATLRGMKLIIDDPDEAAKVYIKAVPTYEGKEDYIRRALKSFADLTFSGQKIIGETDPEVLSQIQALYVTLQIIDKPAAVETLYTNEFVGLDAVK